MEQIIHVRDFQRDVIEKSFSVPVLVDFWAEWCGPCKMLGPLLERLAAEASGRWVLAELDTEEHPAVAADWGIRSIPNVKLFIEGVVADEFTGALPEYAVRQWLAKALPGPSAKSIAQARAKLAAGDTAGAAAMLEDLAAAEPGNDEARVLLARAVLLSDTSRAAVLIRGIEEPLLADDLETVSTIVRLREILDAVQPLPDSAVKEAYLSAVRKLFAGDYDGALEGFIGVIREDRYFDDDGSRKACLAIFRLLGEEHEVTLRHRREFGSALYV